jgi:hypothetical protein
VKLVEKHISRLLLTAAIFLVFGNVAIANEAFSNESKASVVNHLQQDDSSKPFLFNEISVGEGSQSISQNEYLGTGFFGVFYSAHKFRNVQVSSSFVCSYSLKDKREIIFQYLFPFHFFW